MSGLWLHVRNSPIRLALPVLIVLDLAVLFLRNRFWIGVWPEAGAAAQVPAYLVGAVAAGAAAWAAGAPVRHGLGEQLQAARVHPVRAQAHRLGATLIILLVPYLVGQAVAFAVTARTFPPGVHLWVGYALLGLFVMLVAIAFGWVCGKLLGSAFSALTAALGFLFLEALLDRWVVFTVVSGHPQVAVVPVPLVLRLASVVALLLAMLWLFGPGTPRQHRRRAVVLLPAVMPLAMVMATTSVVADRTPPGDRATCIEGATMLCVWPEHEKYLPQLRAVNARIALLPDAFVPPPRINQFGIETTWYLGPDGLLHELEDSVPSFYILEGSPWSFAGGIGGAISGATFESCDWWGGKLTSSDQRRLWVLDAWLQAYLADQDTPDFQTNAPAQTQEAWAEGRGIAGGGSLAEQFQWAEAEVSDIRGRYCPVRQEPTVPAYGLVEAPLHSTE